MPRAELLIIGASARAAAFSAARGGITPYWIDQYGDADLREAFPGETVDPLNYPQGLLPLVRLAPEAPWMYTGALENHRNILSRIYRLRRLLGNDHEVCTDVRDPWRLRAALQRRGIPCPELARESLSTHDPMEWLMKPRSSAGGYRIAHARGGGAPPAGFYLQRRVKGRSLSGIYLGNGREARLLAITRQLVGDPAFHANEFSYCGSVGPVTAAPELLARWEAIGAALVAEFHLRGLFGVDAIEQSGSIFPIEVNPRYTASVEVIERAADAALVPMHCDACNGRLSGTALPEARQMTGKAYLFAPRMMRIRDNGPLRALPGDFAGLDVADIPMDGTEIPAGRPVMTIFVEAGGEDDCVRLLKENAVRAYDRLERTTDS